MTTPECDALYTGLKIATMISGDRPYGLIDDGAIAVAGGKITWLGERSTLPSDLNPKARHDFDGMLATPGLIDCHTHLVHAGNRAREFELRLKGASYEEIARAGGGIVSTVSATRAATEDDLIAQSATRLDALRAEGVTTVEIKSGYGLDIDTESRMLRVARRLGEMRPVTVVTTFLGAHALPSEFAGRPDDYIDFVSRESLPRAVEQGLVDAVDVFCETIGFTLEQAERVFKAARDLGLPVKLHAEQLSDSKGALLAARYGALSCDHLEYIAEDGIRAMADSGSVAVLLPGAFYFLREAKVPPVDLFRRHGVPIALATDCNPGSSPVTSLLLMLNMGCTLFRLTPEEALAGVTRNAARALGFADRGVLGPGQVADIAFWDVEEPATLAYNIGANPLHGVIREGRRVIGDFA